MRRLRFFAVYFIGLHTLLFRVRETVLAAMICKILVRFRFFLSRFVTGKMESSALQLNVNCRFQIICEMRRIIFQKNSFENR